jgi:predicted nucleotidyltransferase
MLRESWTRNIEEIVDKISRMFEMEGVIVFGSWSRRGGGEWSDLDVLVVSDDVKKINILDRFRIAFELGIPRIDIFIYTYDEVESMLNRMNPLILSALIEGMIVRSSERIRDLIEYARKRFTRRERLWIMKD